MDHLNHIEVELKFPLLNHEELIEKLNTIAKLERKNDFQKDTYFNPPHRDFLNKKPISEWLRVRESKSGSSLNYKKWHNERGNKTISCDEFETKIESVDALKKIFENLDFKELVVVEKTRSVWNYKDTEIAIDEVKGLGRFIEIEAKGNFASMDEAKQQVYKMLKELAVEVGEQDFEGYPYRLLQQKGRL